MRGRSLPDPDDLSPSPPRRRFGQNFLVDRAAASRIVDSLAPGADEPVFEIGPGRGALTEALLQRVDRIAATELDRDLVRLLRARFPAERLVLLEEDVLRLPFSRVAAALDRRDTTRLVIAGNLPYNISKPVAQKLVSEREQVERAVLTFQREVADRLLANHGSRRYGPLAVMTGRCFRIEKIFDLRPGAFRPRPRVVSTVTRWTRREGPPLLPEQENRLRRCLSAAFAHRRQTLLKNLRRVLPGGEAGAREILDSAGLDGSLRAEAVSPEGFERLAAAWPVRDGSGPGFGA
jgi:16S rRNA (adenine1518-N6/adenine1519-N6)-dimethyltransferase